MRLCFFLVILMGMARLQADNPPVPSTAAPNDGEGLTHRVFIVQDTFFPIKPDMILDKKTQSYDVTKQLADKGVHFAPGTQATYQPKLKKLTILNTYNQVMLVEELVNAGAGLFMNKGRKFVEINQ